MSCIFCLGSGAGIRRQLCKQCFSGDKWIHVCYSCRKERTMLAIDQEIEIIQKLHLSEYHYSVDIL